MGLSKHDIIFVGNSDKPLKVVHYMEDLGLVRAIDIDTDEETVVPFDQIVDIIPEKFYEDESDLDWRDADYTLEELVDDMLYEVKDSPSILEELKTKKGEGSLVVKSGILKITISYEQRSDKGR